MKQGFLAIIALLAFALPSQAALIPPTPLENVEHQQFCAPGDFACHGAICRNEPVGKWDALGLVYEAEDISVGFLEGAPVYFVKGIPVYMYRSDAPLYGYFVAGPGRSGLVPTQVTSWWELMAASLRGAGSAELRGGALDELKFETREKIQTALEDELRTMTWTSSGPFDLQIQKAGDVPLKYGPSIADVFPKFEMNAWTVRVAWNSGINVRAAGEVSIVGGQKSYQATIIGGAYVNDIFDFVPDRPARDVMSIAYNVTAFAVSGPLYYNPTNPGTSKVRVMALWRDFWNVSGTL